MEAERVYKNNCSRTIEKVKGRGTYQLVDNRKHTCAMVNRPVVQMNPITSHLYTLMSWATSHPVVSIGAVVLVGGTSLVIWWYNRGNSYWYNKSANKWEKGKPDDTYRQTLREERPDIIPEYVSHKYSRQEDVPVFVKRSIRTVDNLLTPTVPKGVIFPSDTIQPGGETDSLRDPSTRMLDRVARLMGKETDSPHLAVVLINDQILIAGNTGRKRVSGVQKLAAEEVIKIVKLLIDLPLVDDRTKKDRRKLRALMTGDYQRVHPDDAVKLDLIKEKLKALCWKSVDDQGHKVGKVTTSLHGEMALLDEVKTYIMSHPNPAPNPIIRIPLSGVKRDCLFCQWAYALFNTYIAEPKGYKVITAGTHGNAYLNWEAPKWMFANATILDEMRTLVASKAQGKLKVNQGRGFAYVSEGSHIVRGQRMDPYESDSDMD